MSEHALISPAFAMGRIASLASLSVGSLKAHLLAFLAPNTACQVAAICRLPPSSNAVAR